MFRFYLKQTPEKPKHTHLLYGRNNLCMDVSIFHWCMNTGSMFKIESGNIVMVMQWSASLTEDDVTSAPWWM